MQQGWDTNEIKSHIISWLKSTYAIFKSPFVMRALVVALFGIAGIYLFLNVRKLFEFEWEFNLGWLIGAILLIIVAVPLIRVELWRQVLRGLGVSLSFAESFRIIRLSQLAKYVPGQVWHYAGILYMANQAGVSKWDTMMSILQDQGTSFLGGALMVSLLTFVSYSGLNRHSIIWLVVLANAVMGCVFIYAHQICGKSKSFFQSLFDLSILSGLPEFNKRLVLPLILMNMLFWLVLGSSLFCLIRGVTSKDISWTIASLIGIVGVMGGFVVIFAPSGVGVTESLLVSLLSSYFPLEICLAISLLFRVLNIAKEVLLGLVASKMRGGL